MSPEIVHFIDNLLAAWNSHDIEQVTGCYADDYEGRDVGEAILQIGRDGIRQSVARYLDAFPDVIFERDELIIEANRAAVVWIARGTHLGTLMNIPPTGHKVTVTGMSVLTISGGQIIRGLYFWDVAGLLRSINLLPDL